MKIFSLASFFLLVFFTLKCSSHFLHFDPKLENLAGTLEKQTFPGPPNYESIKKGDSAETGWYLKLQEPINVQANRPPTDLGWQTELKITYLQLIFENNYQLLKDRLQTGAKVSVKGKLFNRLTGHHHTRVLVNVISMKEISK